MSEELKPCPFCGSDNVHTQLFDVKGTRFWYVACESCEIALDPLFWDGNKTEQDAIDKWNRRAKE